MRLLCTVFLLFFAGLSQAQVSIVNQSLADTSKAILYVGISNQLKVSGIKNNGVKLAIVGAGGTLYKRDIGDDYIVTVQTTGSCEILLLNNTKTIFKKRFIVETLSPAIATLTGLKDTTAQKSRIKLNPFLKPVFPGSYYKIRSGIMAFNATFIQDGDSLVTYTPGDRLSEEQLSKLNELKPGDKIWFDEIKICFSSGRTVLLPAFWIRIE